MSDNHQNKPEIPVHEWPIGARHVDPDSYGGDMIFLDKPLAPASREYCEESQSRSHLPELMDYYPH